MTLEMNAHGIFRRNYTEQTVSNYYWDKIRPLYIPVLEDSGEEG